MKLHLTAIAFNEKELEAYVSQLKSQHFESISEVKKAEDGSYYQVMAKAVRENIVVPKPAAEAVEAVTI